MPRTPKPRTLSAKRFGPKARKLLRIDDEISALYDKRDKIEAALLKTARPGDRIPLNSDRALQLFDNFTDKDGKPKNVCFRAKKFTQFEFREVANPAP